VLLVSDPGALGAGLTGVEVTSVGPGVPDRDTPDEPGPVVVAGGESLAAGRPVPADAEAFSGDGDGYGDGCAVFTVLAVPLGADA
jgi:hypothetical protein